MRILVAEDDNTTAMLLTRVLKKVGHEVLRVEDGLAALELARNDSGFDAILTDWMMPKMDGVQFIQAARRDIAQLPPIVVITSVASNEAREQVLEAGADDYLAKPVQPDELLHCLDSAVARHRQTWKPVAIDTDSVRPSSSRRLPAPLVLLTAGTGGPMALQRIFRSLQTGSDACFVIVQQGPCWMLETFAHRLQGRTSLPVALASDGEKLKAGQVRIAPGGSHCVIDEDKACLRLTDTAPANFLRPAADVLFRSAARFGEQCIAVILSGMGCDGAMGAELIRMTGGRILVQEPLFAEVASMPQTAVDHGKPEAVLPIDQIAPTLDVWIAQLNARREQAP
jgi:two-component system, chemotaxis family, protein-glutamate methylesterase/glutaminase